MQIYIYGTQGEGCAAVEVLYEGAGTTGSAATCPALKWALSTRVTAEGNSQDTVERSRWEERFFLFLFFIHLCAAWNHRYLLSAVIKHTSRSIMSVNPPTSAGWAGAAVTAGNQTSFPQLSKPAANVNNYKHTEDQRCSYDVFFFFIRRCFNWHLHFFFHRKQWLTHSLHVFECQIKNCSKGALLRKMKSTLILFIFFIEKSLKSLRNIQTATCPHRNHISCVFPRWELVGFFFVWSPFKKSDT